MTKLERINDELNTITKKMNRLSDRKKELERQKIETENSEIIGIVRSGNITKDDLAALLSGHHLGTPLFGNMNTLEEVQNDNEKE